MAKLKAGLVGCGGRGTAAVNDLLSGTQDVEVVAMADLFEDKLESSLKRLKTDARYAKVADRVQVDGGHRFTGFEAYKKMLASDIDYVMLCTPPGWRPVHFVAAVEAKKHIFAEKPFGTDPVGVRKVMDASKKAAELKLTVMSGSQRRSAKDYLETRDKVLNGAIGDIAAAYSWYLSGPVMHTSARDAKWGDMEWEHRNWYSFLWLCGDQIVEQHYHNIDCINWFMGGHPVKALAMGGAAWRPRAELYGNIYDHLATEFTYANGVKYESVCRQYPKGLKYGVSDLIVGTKGRTDCRDLGTAGINPQVQEHINMVNSIRGDGPYVNQGMEVAESTMTCIMGRESAYSGMAITWDEIMASKQDLMPKAFDYTTRIDPTPLPIPGTYKFE